MTVVNAAQASVKTVGDPNAAYESLKKSWDRSRAVCNGERFVKDFDRIVDVRTFGNMLLPFSPKMNQQQYDFFKAEAELPGISAQFSKMLVGGLLRKKPILVFPEEAPPEAMTWIMDEFGKDDSTLTAFLDSALWEEIQTSRAWVFVDYPKLSAAESMTKEELLEYKPYPCLYTAESIINWRIGTNTYGKQRLDQLIVRGYSEVYTSTNEFHPNFLDTVWVHEVVNEVYQIRVFQEQAEVTEVQLISGVQQVPKEKYSFKLVETISGIKFQGANLNFIPAWPLNGSIDVLQPILMPLIDKEISLYNKISRRNHLLYGAATYTPYIIGDMSDEDFELVTNRGLGTWLRIPSGSQVDVLSTPTDSLNDMEKAITSAIEEMAKLGVRMLTPETDQSGVALEIRNAAQTAQMGSLNNKVSTTMKQIICFMLNWRYGLELKPNEIGFTLSADFNPVPLGADWLRLATEWYQQGLIPRSAWLVLLKQNDIIPPDFNDEEAQEEITKDLDLALTRKENDKFADDIEPPKE